MASFHDRPPAVKPIAAEDTISIDSTFTDGMRRLVCHDPQIVVAVGTASGKISVHRGGPICQRHRASKIVLSNCRALQFNSNAICESYAPKARRRGFGGQKECPAETNAPVLRAINCWAAMNWPIIRRLVTTTAAERPPLRRRFLN